MKVIIAGGRDFDNYDLLDKEVSSILNSMVNIPMDDFELVSGGQVTTDYTTGKKYGADYLGEKYAKDNNFDLKGFPADWNKYNKAAGPIRNKQMAEYADVLIAFWDGKSKGTKHMIELAKNKGLKVYIINY